MQISQKAESVLPSHSSLQVLVPGTPQTPAVRYSLEQGDKWSLWRAVGHAVGSRIATCTCLHLSRWAGAREQAPSWALPCSGHSSDSSISHKKTHPTKKPTIPQNQPKKQLLPQIYYLTAITRIYKGLLSKLKRPQLWQWPVIHRHIWIWIAPCADSARQ